MRTNEDLLEEVESLRKVRGAYGEALSRAQRECAHWMDVNTDIHTAGYVGGARAAADAILSALEVDWTAQGVS